MTPRELLIRVAIGWVCAWFVPAWLWALARVAERGGHPRVAHHCDDLARHTALGAFNMTPYVTGAAVFVYLLGGAS